MIFPSFFSRQCVVSLPPTPSKFHYIFNLRDLSRIYNGLCLTITDRFDRIDLFVRVWRNECQRVICDRLINGQDKALVDVGLTFLLIMIIVVVVVVVEVVVIVVVIVVIVVK